MTRTTPLGAVVRGLVAGAIGTLALDAVGYLRYRRGGGTAGFREWEFSSSVQSWADAPAPAQVGRRLVEGVFQRKLPDSSAALVNNLTHWGYGMANGAVYGLLAGSLRKPRVAYGPAFGTAVWLSGYAVLPAAGLYKNIWEYDAKVLADDLSGHLAYGTTTAAAFRVLSPRGDDA